MLHFHRKFSSSITTLEGSSVHPFQIDKIAVDEAPSCFAVQEGLDRVEFACVHSSNFHWQEQESSLHIQDANRKELG